MPAPDPLTSAITRLWRHVQAVPAQSLMEVSEKGRTALDWQSALTGTAASPPRRVNGAFTLAQGSAPSSGAPSPAEAMLP